MTEYIAPIGELNFVINELAGLEQLSKLPAFEHATDDLLEPIARGSEPHQRHR
jgi:hypothetical protein